MTTTDRFWDELTERLVPSPEQVAAALRLIAHRGGGLAFCGLAMPGKTYGIWRTGQEVLHAPGAWIDTDAANSAARRLLRGYRGTTAHVVIWPDGEWAVFENHPGCVA